MGLSQPKASHFKVVLIHVFFLYSKGSSPTMDEQKLKPMKFSQPCTPTKSNGKFSLQNPNNYQH